MLSKTKKENSGTIILIKQEEAPLLSFLFISSSMWAMAIHAHTRTRAKCKLVELRNCQIAV
jgi:hypothetical protein